VVDRLYADPSLAASYDLFCPWDPRGDFGFYLPLVMEAASVLDVGCGTGMLLRRARAEGHAGRFAFETRNPLARGWEDWVPENAVEATDGSGAVVRQEHQVDLPVRGDLVSFTTTYSSPAWQRPQHSRSLLRFLVADALSAFLAGAGLEVAEQYGDWDRSALAAGSPEIITIAKPYCLTVSNICSIVM
jgi:SAM-dependent methyltransferase